MNIKIFSIGIAILISTGLFAQTNGGDNGLEGTFGIATIYKVKVTDAIKMDVVPVNETLVPVKPPISYTMVTKLFPTERIIEVLPPVSFKIPSDPPLDHVYIKAGLGNYSNIYADVNYSTTKFKDFLMAVEGKQHSGKATPKNSNGSEQLFKISGKKMFNNRTLSSRLYVDNRTAHLYGYDHDSFDFVKDSIKRNYFNSGIKVSFNNELDDKAKIKYWTYGGFDYFMDNSQSHEIGGLLGGALEQHFRENPIHFEAKYNFYNLFLDDRSFNRNTLDIIAKFNYKMDNFRAKVGFDVATENDSTATKTHFYPDLNIEGDFFDNNLTAYAGLKGGLKTNTFKSITEENPYILSDINLRNTNEKLDLYAGLKGSIAQRFNYNLGFSYKTVENLMMFVNDSADIKRFITVYDTGNTTIMKINAGIYTKVMEDLIIHLSATYNKYDLSTELFAWQLPDYEVKLGAKYNIEDKIYFTLDFFTVGARQSKTYDALGNVEALELPAIYDLNFGVTYKFSDQFGIFFNFNNILANKYSYWNQYELRGFHLLGGVQANLF